MDYFYSHKVIKIVIYFNEGETFLTECNLQMKTNQLSLSSDLP